MKKTYIAMMASMLLFHCSFAQNEKGSLLFGADIAYSNNESSSSLQSATFNENFSVNASFARAVKKNVFVGLTLGYSSFRSDYYNSQYNIHQRAYNYGVLVRQYFPIKGSFSAFVQATASGSTGSGESFDSNFVKKGTLSGQSYGLNFSPGISFKLSQKLQLEAGLQSLLNLNYTTQSSKSVEPFYPFESKTTQFGVSSSINNSLSTFSVGFRLLLQKNKT